MKKQIIPSKKIQTNERNRFKLIGPFVLFYLFASAFYPSASAFSQNIGINTTGAIPNSSAGLDVDYPNKGLLIPRVSLLSTTDVTTIPSPANSLLVYNTNAAMTSGAIGYWYYNTSIPAWMQLAAAAAGGNDWTILGNAGTVDGTNFIGTTDNIPFNIRVNNLKAGRIDHINDNVLLGYQSGNVNTGIENTAIGNEALYSNTSGDLNTAIGNQALYSNTNADFNVAVGTRSLWSNQTGSLNTAIGINALYTNVSGSGNIAIGQNVLYANTGNSNTTMGYGVLTANTGGSNATAIGYAAMYYNQTPGTNSNVALGYEALRGSTTVSANTGNFNTALGYQALLNNTAGAQNTATGYQALYYNNNGGFNTAFGYLALNGNYSGSSNTAVGSSSLQFNSSGIGNVAIGVNALRSNVSGGLNVTSQYP